MNKLKHVYGLNHQLRSNLQFAEERVIVYIYGNHIVLCHLDQKWQKFIQISDKNVQVTAMAISTNRRFLALAEISKVNDLQINIFDLSILRKRKTLIRSRRPKSSSPEEEHYTQLVFSSDSKYVAASVGVCEVEFWAWEKCRLEASHVVCNTQQKPTQIYSLSFNIEDSSIISVTCQSYVRFLKYSNNSLSLSSALKLNQSSYVSQAWIDGKILLLGSSDGNVVVVEENEIKNEIKIVTKNEENNEEEKRVLSANKKLTSNPLCIGQLVAIRKGFVCCVGKNQVFQFETTEGIQFKKSKSFQLPVDEKKVYLTENKEDIEAIASLIVSPHEEVILCSSSHNLIYSAVLSLASDLSQVEESAWLRQGHFNHSKMINDMSVCLRKPLLVTSAHDNCVKVWDYENNCMELSSIFPEEISTVSIHPTGFFLLVGFSSGLVVMNILVNEFKPIKHIPIKQSPKAVYSHGGHFFAVANGNQVCIYASLTFENVHNLKGHLGKVKSIVWSSDDQQLLACATGVYLWQVYREKKVSELITRSCDYVDACFSSDEKSYVVVGDDHVVKEVVDGQIVRSIQIAEEVTCLTTIGRMLVVTLNSGTVCTIKYPLSESSVSYHPTHHCPITKVAISLDEQYVVTCGRDGGIVVASVFSLKKTGLFSTPRDEEQEIKNEEKEENLTSCWMIKKEMVFLDEVLISKRDYEEQNLLTRELQQRLEDVRMEQEYKERLLESQHQEKLKFTNEAFQKQLGELNETIQSLKNDKEKQERWSDEGKKLTSEQHSKQLQDQESKNNHKLLLEYEKYQELQSKSQRMQEEYEGRLVELKKQSDDQLQTLTQQDTLKITQLSSTINQLEKKIEETERLKEEMLKEVEDDADEEVTSIKMSMQKVNDALRAENEKLTGQMGMITKKLVSLYNDVDSGKEEIGKKEKKVKRLEEIIGNLEKEVKNLRKEIRERESTLQEKEKRISELKRSNEELNKYKYVLKERLAQLEDQIAPHVAQISSANEHLTEMEKELDKKKSMQDQSGREINSLKQKLLVTENELNLQKKKTAKINTVLDRIKTDIHRAAALVQEPASLKEAVKRMHAKHVQSDINEVIENEANVSKEFSRQRDHLERTINTVNNNYERGITSANADNAKILRENVELVEEVNRLRQELMYLKSKNPKATNKNNGKTSNTKK